MKLYVSKDGVDYYGYTLFGKKLDYLFDGAEYAFDRSVAEKFRNIDFLVDTTLKPKKGASLNVIQDCALPVATIRNSYTIKRGYDTAEYNVFSSQDVSAYCSVYQIVLYPPAKVAYVNSEGPKMTRKDLADVLQTYVPHIPIMYDDCVVIEPVSYYVHLFRLRKNINEAPFFGLLDGVLKKPSVSYNQLDLTTDNVLTPDTLYIIYKLGTEPVDGETVKKLAIQVKALEQMNIDLYPGTMTLLNMVFRNARRTSGEELISTRSRYDKATKRILSISKDPISNDDYAMGQALLDMILSMQDVKFTDMDVLLKKIKKFNIPWMGFNMFYSNMVKLSKKTTNGA